MRDTENETIVRTLAEPLERAVSCGDLDALGAALGSACASPRLNAMFSAPSSSGYARRLLWEDPDQRFVVVAMTWGAGQGAPLHDHAGGWCAEGVVEGNLVETTFELVDRDDARGYRFAERERQVAPAGGVRVLVPPHEYHVVANSHHGVARTIHVYAARFQRCTQFRPSGQGWWSAEERTLGYDAGA